MMDLNFEENIFFIICHISTLNITSHFPPGRSCLFTWPVLIYFCCFQLYIDGELIGGLDILREMDASGELSSMLPKKQKLEDK